MGEPNEAVVDAAIEALDRLTEEYGGREDRCMVALAVLRAVEAAGYRIIQVRQVERQPFVFEEE